MAARWKVWGCGCLPAGIVGSNLAGDVIVCCECSLFLVRGLCDVPITRPEESYRNWCAVLCDLETSIMRRFWPALGRSATANKISTNASFYLAFRSSYGCCILENRINGWVIFTIEPVLNNVQTFHFPVNISNSVVVFRTLWEAFFNFLKNSFF